jgi:DNA polymerase-3 subunit epsilon
VEHSARCEHAFVYDAAVLLALESADRLVHVLAERGPLPAGEAARTLFAVSGGPTRLAIELLDRIVAADGRLVRRGGEVGLAAVPWAETPIERARYAVVDIETTGFAARNAAITEAAVVLLAGDQVLGELELPAEPERGSREVARQLVAAAGGAVLVGHNVRFDLGFLDRELGRDGLRIAAPVVDTLTLARRLLAGRAEGVALADLAELFGTNRRPEHRALPDARATAEVFGHLARLAREAGARTVADLAALARPRPQQVRAGR